MKCHALTHREIRQGIIDILTNNNTPPSFFFDEDTAFTLPPKYYICKNPKCSHFRYLFYASSIKKFNKRGSALCPFCSRQLKALPFSNMKPVRSVRCLRDLTEK